LAVGLLTALALGGDGFTAYHGLYGFNAVLCAIAIGERLPSADPSAGLAGRLGRRRVAMLALAGLVALGLVAVPVLGSRPRVTAVARSFKLANGTVIGIEAFFDARNFPRLRQQFADAGATLVIDEIPVHDRAIGRVFSVQLGFGQPPAPTPTPPGSGWMPGNGGMGQHRPVHRHPDGGGDDQPRGPRAAGSLNAVVSKPTTACPVTRPRA
jgi:hypothetical protein